MELAQQRQKQRAEEEREREQKVKDANALFELRPGWSIARVTIYEEGQKLKENVTEEEKVLFSEPRLQYVIRFLDVWGKSYVSLVSDRESQKAFEALMYDMSMTCWFQFSGLPPEMVPARHPIEDRRHPWTRFADRIIERANHWAVEGLRRLNAAALSTPSAPAPVRRGYRNEIRSWMNQKEITSVPQAAKPGIAPLKS